MESKSFVYWLQGFFEISGAKTLSEAQVEIIRNHLNLVFKHEIDPTFGDEKKQEELGKIHSPRAPNPGALIKC